MKKTTLISAVVTAFSLVTLEAAQAATQEMEKCQIIGYDKNGKEVGIIKPGKADCSGTTTSCGGTNPDDSKKAWIYLPKGICEKIEGGIVFSDKKAKPEKKAK